MVQIINDEYSGNIFGRLGKGIGKGLSEQLPKELERKRLSSGLEKLGDEAVTKKLTPLQVFTRGAGIYGATPQIIESLGDLSRQQAQGEALSGFGGDERTSFPGIEKESADQGKNAPSITTRNPIEAVINPYIPKDYKQIQQRASELFNKNKAFYKNDPQLAINAAVQEDAQDQSINSALQSQRTGEKGVQDDIVRGLQAQQEALGARVPGNVFSDIEDKAINAVKSKRDGGEGLTEQEAKKKYGKELDSISRDYEALESIGRFGMLSRSASSNKDTLKSIRKKFIDRNDQENLADRFISKNGLSPSKAYYLAYPVSQEKELNNSISKLPNINPQTQLQKIVKDVYSPDTDKKTLEISKKLAPLLGKKGSPLSVAEELKSRGYDPNIWMKYIRDNRDKLDLTESQGRQLDKPKNFTPTMSDIWLFSLSGLDELMEQK